MSSRTRAAEKNKCRAIICREELTFLSTEVVDCLETCEGYLESATLCPRCNNQTPTLRCVTCSNGCLGCNECVLKDVVSYPLADRKGTKCVLTKCRGIPLPFPVKISTLDTLLTNITETQKTMYHALQTENHRFQDLQHRTCQKKPNKAKPTEIEKEPTIEDEFLSIISTEITEEDTNTVEDVIEEEPTQVEITEEDPIFDELGLSMEPGDESSISTEITKEETNTVEEVIEEGPTQVETEKEPMEFIEEETTQVIEEEHTNIIGNHKTKKKRAPELTEIQHKRKRLEAKEKRAFTIKAKREYPIILEEHRNLIEKYNDLLELATRRIPREELKHYFE